MKSIILLESKLNDKPRLIFSSPFGTIDVAIKVFERKRCYLSEVSLTEEGGGITQ